MLNKETDSTTVYVENKASAAAATSSIFLNSPNLRWLVVGTSIGIFLIIVGTAVACWYGFKRKGKESNKEKEEKLDHIITEKNVEERFTTSAESSMDSIELPKDRGYKNLRPSLSFDIGAPFLLRKHSVQPSVTFPRWNSLSTPRSSIGTVQPEQCRSSDSDEASKSPNDTGRLWFSLLYKEETNILQVTLIRAKHLPARGLSKGVRDPFVKIFLMPDEETYQQSTVRKRTLSPKFKEVFNFEVKKEELCHRSLRFSVYDVDKRKIRHCLGHVVVALDKVDVVTDTPLCRDLDKISQLQLNGEMQISLACNPFNNRLKVTIIKARNIDASGFENSLIYVKVDLFHGQKLVKSKSTNARSMMGPLKSEVIFHEIVSFGVPAKFYDSCYVALSAVISGGGEKSDRTLGKVTLGPFLFSRGESLLHWQEMVSNPRTMITRWHKLEPER